jgi:hypothetical protein
LKQQRRRKPRNPAIAVTEGVDTKEVENERGHDQERRNTFFIAGDTIRAAQRFDGRGRLPGGDWHETNGALPVRQDLDDFVVALLPLAGVSGRSALGKSVEATEDIRRNRDRTLA